LQYQKLRDGLARLLKNQFPLFDIFFEEITKTSSQTADDEMTKFIFIDIIPVQSTTRGLTQSQHLVLVDIAVFDASAGNREYFAIGETLDVLVRPILDLGDWKIVVQQAERKIVDNILHYIFHLNYGLDRAQDNVETMEGITIREIMKG
jgi:hypothetical protein